MSSHKFSELAALFTKRWFLVSLVLAGLAGLAFPPQGLRPASESATATSVDWGLVAITLVMSVPIGLLAGRMFRDFLDPGGFPPRAVTIPFFAICCVMALTNGIRGVLGNVTPMGFASAAAAAAFLLIYARQKKETPGEQQPSE